MSKDDWKKCFEWFVALEVIDPNFKLSNNQDQVSNFAQILQDGVILCNTLNIILPGVLNQSEFSKRPQLSQFLRNKNVSVFLNKCEQVFEIRNENLFDPNDLLKLKNFSKVINTLSLLSNTKYVLQKGISGFHVESNEDYGALSSIDSEGNDNLEDAYMKTAEKTYQDIISMQKMEPVQVSKMTKREFGIKEVLETERRYIEVLRMIIINFEKPLNNKLQIDSNQLFKGINELLVVHQGFYSDLSKACQSRHGSIRSSNMTISDCFIKWKEKFLYYGTYCSELNSLLSSISKLMEDHASKEEIIECEKNAGKFKLPDLMTVPMQRVLRYPLLLKELLKNTDLNHPERKTLERAYEEMLDLAAYVNESNRDTENLAHIDMIQKSFSIESINLKEYGHFEQDGELRYRQGDEKKEKTGFMFLFDKILLICKPKAQIYSIKKCYEVSNSKVEMIPPREKDKYGFHLSLVFNENISATPSSSLNNNSFGNKNKTVTIIFFAKSEKARKKWVESFEKAIEKVFPADWFSSKHRFILTSFQKATICDVCRKFLRGVFFQGYKCAHTGLVVHKGCMSQAKEISGPPTLPPRETSLHRAKALVNYHGNPPPPQQNPLFFQENDTITIISTECDPWWHGRNSGNEGYFHKTYVTVLKQREPSLNIENISSLSTDSLHPNSRPNRVQSLINPQSNNQNKVIVNSNSFSHLKKAPPLPFRSSSRNFSNTLSPTPLIQSISSTISPNKKIQSEIFGEDLTIYQWYVGEMTRERASELLNELLDGAFLVRVSKTSDRRGQLSLSVKYGVNPVWHIKIQKNSNKNWFLGDNEQFNSVAKLISYYQKNSLGSCFTELPISLTVPFKDTLPVPSG